MSEPGITVLKFGGTSLASPRRIRAAAQRVRAERLKGLLPVVVVSARGNTTDRLLRDVASVTTPDRAAVFARECDRALATGEALSAALLAAALGSLDLPAASVTAAEATLVAEGEHGSAHLTELRPGRVAELLDRRAIPVVTGFQGVRADGEVVTLGRGSSDATAVFLGAALGAVHCHIVTDVDGVYDADPRKERSATRFEHLTFDALVDLTSTGAEVVHREAALCAARHSLPLRVYHYASSQDAAAGTLVSGSAA